MIPQDGNSGGRGENAQQESLENLSGREIAGCRLLHVLGRGGASEVYLAQRLDDPSALVAIKILAPSWQFPPGERAAFSARFAREAQAAQRLQHPHILPVLAYGAEGEISYMVLPFMPGGTLSTQLAAAPQGIPLSLIVADLRQVADALDYAHARGVIHRDVKPTNVLVAADGSLALADFGIARLFDPDGGDAGEPNGDAGARRVSQPLTTLTMTGQVLGTPIYMAPEQLLSARVGPAADIYSLGVVLYQLATGVAPFAAETPIGLAMQHVQETPMPPRLRRYDLPEPAEAAILKALAKAPEQRFPTARALADAFAAGVRGKWSAGLASTAIQTPPPTVVATPPPTVVATPPPGAPPGGYSGAPYMPVYSAPIYPQPYSSGAPYASAPRARSGGSNVLLAVFAMVAVVAVVLASLALGLHLQTGSTATVTSSPPPGSTAPSTSSAPSVLVPAGQLLYYTQAGGPCDSQGAAWATNNQASQTCDTISGDILIVCQNG